MLPHATRAPPDPPRCALARADSISAPPQRLSPCPRDRYTLNDLVGQSHGLFQIGPYEGFREDIELVSGQGAGQHSR
jgi:hypothetical protein